MSVLTRVLVMIAVIMSVPTVGMADRIDDAWAALDAERWDEARDAARAALAEAGTDRARLEASEVLATLRYYLDEPAAALASAEQLDREATGLFGIEAPERLVALSLLGWLYSENGATGAAIDAVTRAIRIGRRSGQSDDTVLGQMLQLAELYLDSDRGRVAAALAAEVAASAVDIWGDEDPLALEAGLLRAAAHLRLGHPVEASLHAATLLQRPDLAAGDPYLADRLAVFRSDLSARAAGEPEALARWSREAASRAETRNRQETQVLTLLGDVQTALENGETDLFDTQLRRVAAMLTADDPGAAQIYALGIRTHLAADDPQAADFWAVRLSEFPPGYLATLKADMSPMLLDLADLLARQGRLPEAAARADLALAVAGLRHPAGALPVLQAHYRRADIALSMGRPATAAAQLGQALPHSPAQGPEGVELHANLLLLASEVAAGAGDFDTANQALEEILRLGATSGQVRFDTLTAMAVLQMRQGAHARAVPLLEEARDLALALFGDTTASTNTATALLAAALFESGDQDRAMDLYAPLMAQEGSVGAGQASVVSALALIDMRMQRRAGAATRSPAPRDMPQGDGGGVLTAALAEESWFAGQSEAAAAYADTVLETGRRTDAAWARAALVKARLALDEGDEVAALTWLRQLTEALSQSTQGDPRLARVHLALQADAALALAAKAGNQESLALIDEALTAAQWANALAARSAFDQAASRWRAPGPLAEGLRAVQDADREVDAARATLRDTMARGAKPEVALVALNAAEAAFQARSVELRTAFPRYATAADPQPIGLAEIAAALDPDEVLIVYLSSDEQVRGMPASQIVAVTSETVQTAALASASDLRDLAARLRCTVALTDLTCTDSQSGETRGSFDMDPEPRAAGAIDPVGFDFELAYQAYQEVISPVADVLAGKEKLIVVPDAAVLGLPFNVLIATAPGIGTSFASADWSLRHRSVQVIPTVAGFIRLRQNVDAKTAGDAFLGVGDPLVGGQVGGPVDFDCGLMDEGEGEVLAYNRARGAPRGVAMVTKLPALPDTRCELRRSAAAWPGPRDLLLHGDATEARLRGLSSSGTLKRYAAITFATHGLVAGEVGAYDAGLVLTPDADDDGLLSTAEVAQLDLDADIVILSACNTAAGSSDSGEGLSGLASAFFYAGARSLMVSAWPVYSDAAVRLSAGALSRMAVGDRGPAEALRLSMLDILDDPDAADRQKHPSYWAPFFVVGGS